MFVFQPIFYSEREIGIQMRTIMKIILLNSEVITRKRGKRKMWSRKQIRDKSKCGSNGNPRKRK